MSAKRDLIKTYFETGDTPTQAQFYEWLDAIVFDDEVRLNQIIEDEIEVNISREYYSYTNKGSTASTWKFLNPAGKTEWKLVNRASTNISIVLGSGDSLLLEMGTGGTLTPSVTLPPDTACTIIDDGQIIIIIIH